MADLNYDVSANTSGAIRSLDQLNSKVKGIGDTFGGLQRAIAGIAFGNIINGALQFAAGIQDISDSTGIATANILGFSSAVAQSGGNFEKAQAGILKLVENIGEARNGSKSAIESFQKVGVSVLDLKTLSEQDILAKTIKGLAGIDDRSKRAAASTDLLGKALRGVDVDKVAGTYEISVRQSAQYAESVRNAADAQDNLDKAITDFKIALLEALKPLTEVLQKISLNIDLVKGLIQQLILLGALAASFTLIGRAVTLLIGLFRGLSAAALGLRNILGSTNEVKFFISIRQWLEKNIESIQRWGSLLVGGATYVTLFGESTEDAAKKLEDLNKQSLEFHKQQRLLAQQPVLIDTGGQKAPKGFDSLRDYFSEERFKRRQEAAEKLQSRLDTLRDKISSVAVEFQNYSNNLQENNKQTIEGISLSENQIELNEALTEVRNRARDSISEYTEMLKNLQKDEQGLRPIIEAQIEKIKARAAANEKSVRESITATQDYAQSQRDIVRELELISQAQNEAFEIDRILQGISTIGLYGDELERTQIILEVSNELRSKLLRIGEQERRLIEDKIKLGDEEFDKQMAHLETLRQKAYEYANTRIELEQQVLEAQRAAQQDWQGALKQQLEDLADSISPARMAADMFGGVISSIDDALTNFIQKGKFNFKDFATSLLKDMALIIARALIMRAILAAFGLAGFGPMASAGGSSAMSLNYTGPRFGGAAAKGGSLTPGKSFLVGELGPELFVPRTAGTVIPNNQLGMAAPSQTQVTYNINAVDAQSFRALVARDPQFIFNVSEVGRRSNPSRRLA